MFDAESFVSDCQAAAAEVDPVAAVHEVVAAAIVDGPSIDAALGTESRENTTLLPSNDLTAQRITWLPGLPSSRHEHRMWAVVGVYAGQELNRIFERVSDGIRECDSRVVAEGDVFVLGPDALHSVENPGHERTAALHVYGGDILNIERSAWGPDGREVPFAENSSARNAMLNAFRELVEEHGKQIDVGARYRVFTALTAACEREGRYPTHAEARGIITDAWKLAP